MLNSKFLSVKFGCSNWGAAYQIEAAEWLRRSGRSQFFELQRFSKATRVREHLAMLQQASRQISADLFSDPCLSLTGIKQLEYPQGRAGGWVDYFRRQAPAAGIEGTPAAGDDHHILRAIDAEHCRRWELLQLYYPIYCSRRVSRDAFSRHNHLLREWLFLTIPE